MDGLLLVTPLASVPAVARRHHLRGAPRDGLGRRPPSPALGEMIAFVLGRG
ncbi:MAG TPA: hypothetical protein VF841_09630 [Anaeromyxobacter sp.]